jgi:hypothetical protein
MDKKQKSNYREIKKKMKKLTLAEKKQIKEKEKQKEQRKEKQQKITQRVKVNINIPRSIGGSQSSGFSNFPFPFPKDNTEQTSLLKSINEQLKQKNEPKSSNELFSIPSSVMTNSPDLTNRNMISPQRIRNIPEVRFDIPNVVNKPKDTSNFSLDEVVKNKVKEYNENLAMGKEEKEYNEILAMGKEEKGMRDKNQKVKEYNENLAMGKEEKRIPIVDVPEDTSNLGMMERINKKEEEEIKPVEEGKSVFEQNIVSFKIKKKKPEDEEKRLKKEEEKRLKIFIYSLPSSP